MNIKLENKPKSTVELTIEVEPKEYQPQLKNAAKKLSHQIKIDGFRAGNVPYNIMVQKVGESKILNQALSDIITSTFVQAITQKKLDTIGQPEINVTKIAPGNNLIYKAKVTLLPNLELPDLNTIKINKQEVKIDDQEIDHILGHLAKSRAQETLADHPALNKNLVRLDYNISIAGVPQEGGQQKNFELYLGDSHMVPGFEQKIIGLKKDDTKKFDIKFPDDYFQKNFAGKTATFDVKINGVYDLNIPKINDDFAKSIGSFKNLAELKQQIKDNIKAEKTTRQNKKLEIDILDKIIEKTKFDELPDNLISNEVQAIIHELESDLAMKGLKIQTWLENMRKDIEELKKDLRPQAERRAKSALIIRAVARKKKIKVNNEEIEAELDKLKKTYQDNPEIQKQLESPTYKNHLANVLNGQKTMDWLKKKIVN